MNNPLLCEHTLTRLGGPVIGELFTWYCYEDRGHSGNHKSGNHIWMMSDGAEPSEDMRVSKTALDKEVFFSTQEIAALTLKLEDLIAYRERIRLAKEFAPDETS